jgi:nucleotide-binding universal stress UspA family protein
MLRLSTVLSALDFAPGSERALVRAADLAERAHASLHLLHVSPLFRARLATAADGPDGDTAFHDRVEAFVNEAMGSGEAFGLLSPVVHRATGEVPSEGLVRHAEAIGAGLIVMGTHGRTGLGHMLLGSVAAETLRTSAVPVLVIPDRAETTAPSPAQPVLVAVDFSGHTLPALRWARDLAAAYEAPLELVHVVDHPAGTPMTFGGLLSLGDLPSGPGAPGAAVAADALRRLADAQGLGVAAVHAPVGTAEVELLRLAESRDAGLIVMGTHGRSGWARMRLGSVAETVLRQAPCPVLALPPALAEAEGA